MHLRTYTLLLVSLLIAGSLAVTALLRITTGLLDRATASMATAIRSVHHAEQLRADLLIHNRESYLLGLTGQSEHATRVNLITRSIWDDYAVVSTYVESEEEQQLVLEVREAVEQYLTRRAQLTSSSRSVLEVYEQIVPVLQRADAAVAQLVQLNLAQAQAAHARVEEDNRLVNRLALVMGLVLIAAGAAILITMRQGVYLPLVRLRRAIADVPSESVTREVPVAGFAELRQISQTFNQMIQSLSRQQQVQLRFLAAVAHDLRNPLTAIRQSMQLVDVEHTEDLQPTLELIRRQLGRLESMVGDLLDRTRIQAGQLELRIVEYDLRESLHEVAALYQAFSSTHPIAVHVPDQPVICCCDPLRVGQVLNNLVSNAIKYSPGGCDVDLTLTVQDTHARIAVEDRGSGIAPDDLPHIFEPFRRSRATRETIPGVGLGLAVSRRIIEGHGGSIHVESQLGHGSVFTVLLPLTGPTRSPATLLSID